MRKFCEKPGVCEGLALVMGYIMHGAISDENWYRKHIKKIYKFRGVIQLREFMQQSNLYRSVNQTIIIFDMYNADHSSW